MDWIKRVNALILKNKKKALEYAIIVAAVGAILIVLSSFFDSPNNSNNTSSQATQKNALTTQMDGINEDLQNILSCIRGAGNVKVMISYDSTVEQVLAKETTQSMSQQTQGDVQNTQKQYQDRIVMKDSTDGSGPAVIKEVMPRPLGVLVVASGADNPSVKESIIAGVKAVTGLAEYKIQVITAG